MNVFKDASWNEPKPTGLQGCNRCIFHLWCLQYHIWWYPFLGSPQNSVSLVTFLKFVQSSDIYWGSTMGHVAELKHFVSKFISIALPGLWELSTDYLYQLLDLSSTNSKNISLICTVPWHVWSILTLSGRKEFSRFSWPVYKLNWPETDWQEEITERFNSTGSLERPTYGHE